MNPTHNASKTPETSVWQAKGFAILGVLMVVSAVGSWLKIGMEVLPYLSSRILACAWNFGWAIMFVGSIYVWKYEAPMNAQLRDTKRVIIHRFVSVGIVTTSFVLFSPFSWSILGLPPSFLQNLAGVIIGLLVICLLYLGPLVKAFFNSDGFFAEFLDFDASPWVNFRTILFAPLFEEVAFRSCMIPVMLHAGFSVNAAIFITPFIFGLAHVHHILVSERRYLTLKVAGFNIKIQEAVLQVALQATYTTVFGWIASFLFLHTGTLSAPFIAHALCNFLGLPSLDFDDRPSKTVLLGCYFLGIVLFLLLIGPLSSSPYFFTSIDLLLSQ